MHKPLLAASLTLAVSACGGNVAQPIPETPSTDAGAEIAPPPAPQTLGFTEVSIDQAIKIVVFDRDGVRPDSTVPVVAGRPALIRVAAAPGKGWIRKVVKAVLTLQSGTGPAVTYETTQSVSTAAFKDSDLGSTLNFEVPGEAIDGTTTVSVTLAEPGPTGATWAKLPADGTMAPLLGKNTGAQLKIVIVPVQYAGDGSSRAPETGPDALKVYGDVVFSMYPTRKVDISVRAPFEWKDVTDPDGTGWDTLLSAMVELRATDKADADVYYYGVFKPADTFWKYCKKGCVAGLSGRLVDPRDAFGRASIGLGYGDESSGMTMAHEVGHAHGRSHAPCGDPAGIDKKFPYSDGSIGVQGYDLVNKELRDPGYSDLMGYCEPRWISDYTYRALVDRMTFVNSAKFEIGAPTGPRAYRVVRLDPKGKLVWGQRLVLDTPPRGEPHELEVETDAGTVKMTAQLYRYDDLPGGMLVLPDPPTKVRAVSVSGLTATRATLRL